MEKAVKRFVTGLLLGSFAFCSVAIAQSPHPTNPWQSVEAAMGRPGQKFPGGVIKFGFPRSDLKVQIRGIEVKPGLALGSWVGFERIGTGAMVMGDLVLTEREVEPVMQKLQSENIDITALHNHLLWEVPRVMYMHIHGSGHADVLARAIFSALKLTKTPLAQQKLGPAAAGTKTDLDVSKIEQALGHKGAVNGGILQIGVPRAEEITQDGHKIPPSLGVSTALNFQGTVEGKALTTGDFVLLGNEVNSVMKALREHNIEVTAVHSHMLNESPRLFFMHFWGNGDALALASGLRAALDKTNSAK